MKNPALRLSEAYCARRLARNGQDLDLSEYQFLNDMSSQSSTRNPLATHEALGAVCGFRDYGLSSGATWATHDAVLTAARGIRLAEEAENPWPVPAKSRAMLAEAQGLVPLAGADYKMGYCTPNPPVADANPRYDRFNFDPHNVSYDARYLARYGVTGVQAIPASDARKTSTLRGAVVCGASCRRGPAPSRTSRATSAPGPPSAATRASAGRSPSTARGTCPTGSATTRTAACTRPA